MSHTCDPSQSNQHLKMHGGDQNNYYALWHTLNKHSPTNGEQVAKGNFLTNQQHILKPSTSFAAQHEEREKYLLKIPQRILYPSCPTC